MNELELKYGCNPNQKPSRIFQKDGSDLPVTFSPASRGYINFLDALNSWQLVKELKEATVTCCRIVQAPSRLAGSGRVGMPLTDVGSYRVLLRG